MIKHIVLFQLKEFPSKEAKELKLKEIKSKLENLINLVPTLKKIEVELNCNPQEAYDIYLYTEFENMEDLEAYAIHPEHVAVGKIIREVLEKRACVDACI